MSKADDLRAQADALEAQGHVAGDVPTMRSLWRQADDLRAQADALDAAAIDWRSQVVQRVHDAARAVLQTQGDTMTREGLLSELRDYRHIVRRIRSVAELHAATRRVDDPCQHAHSHAFVHGVRTVANDVLGVLETPIPLPLPAEPDLQRQVGDYGVAVTTADRQIQITIPRQRCGLVDLSVVADDGMAASARLTADDLRRLRHAVDVAIFRLDGAQVVHGRDDKISGDDLVAVLDWTS